MNQLATSHPFFASATVWGVITFALLAIEWKSNVRDLVALVVYGVPLLLTLAGYFWKHSWKFSGMSLLGMTVGMLLAMVIGICLSVGEFKNFRLF